jgi:hypothetical protein
MLVQYKADIIIISLKINLFSPWYSWKFAELALNNNQSLTHSYVKMNRIKKILKSILDWTQTAHE